MSIMFTKETKAHSIPPHPILDHISIYIYIYIYLYNLWVLCIPRSIKYPHWWPPPSPSACLPPSDPRRRRAPGSCAPRAAAPGTGAVAAARGRSHPSAPGRFRGWTPTVTITKWRKSYGKTHGIRGYNGGIHPTSHCLSFPRLVHPVTKWDDLSSGCNPRQSKCWSTVPTIAYLQSPSRGMDSWIL